MRSIVLCAALGAGCAPAAQVVTPAAPPVAARPAVQSGYAEVVARVLPSVVLLVRTDPGGAVHFGAGFLVETDGRLRALSNEHVAAGPGVLRAMLHDSHRTSYTPMDGGLDRFLFENQTALRPAKVVVADAIGDLALVEIDAPSDGRRPLPLSDRPAAIGEEVLAFGHPQETVWSFTAGVVSAQHHGMIQHDAILSGGSSGGPLVSVDGRVIGVNTAKITSAVRGLGFARPIALAGGLLHPETRAASTTSPPRRTAIDRSSVERAVLECWHAQELASTAMAECFDWPTAYGDVHAALDLLAQRLPADVARVRHDLEARGGLAGFAERNRLHLVEAFRTNEVFEPASITGLTGARAAVAIAIDRKRLADNQAAARVRKDKNHIGVDMDDLRRLRELLRRGLRVDEVHLVGARAAWVRLAGRNPDGTTLTFSELWLRSDDGWRQRIGPGEAEAGPPPAGWPATLESHTCQLDELQLQVLRRAEALAADEGARPGGGSERAAPSPRR